MKGGLRILVCSVFFAAACANRPAPPQLSPDQAIVVLPPNNRTAGPLLVAGASFLDRYALHAERVTIEDVLAGETRSQLAERGFRVVPRETVAAATDGRVPRSVQAAAEIAAHGKLEGLALYLEIRHWSPTPPFTPPS